MALLNKPGNELLIDLINEANNLQLTPGMLVFGEPQVVDPPSPRNTDILATPTEELPMASAPVTFNYQRLDLNVLLGGLPKGFDEDEVGILTTADLLPLINDRFNLAMTVDDIVVESIVRNDTWPLNVTLTASPTSLTFVGSTTIRLEYGKPPGETSLFALFAISNSARQVYTEDLTNFDDFQGEQFPISSETNPIRFANTYGGLILGVRNSDETTGILIYRSDDGGVSWQMELRVGLTIVGKEAVMFKDGFYIAARNPLIDTDSNDEESSCGLYRIWWNGDFELVVDRAMDLPPGNGIDHLKMACNQNHLAVYAKGELHLTTNGVDWAKWPLPLVAANMSNPELTQWDMLAMTAARPTSDYPDYFYGVGRVSANEQTPGHHLAMIRFRVYAGETGPAISNLEVFYGSSESSNGLPYPWYDNTIEDGSAWSVGSVALHCTQSGNLLMGFGYLNQPDGNGVLMGSIWSCPEGSLDSAWTQVHAGNGVNQGRFLESGDVIIYYGSLNVMAGGTENMVYSELEGVDWFDDPAGNDSPFKAASTESSSVAVRNLDAGEIMFQEELPMHFNTTQTRPDLEWFEGSIHAGIQTSDARALLGGEFSAAGGQPLSTNVIKFNDFGAIDPDDPTSLIDPFFNPVVVGPVYALCEGGNGGGAFRYYIGGSITQVNGMSRPGLAAITISGTLDDNFASVDLRDANNLPATVRGVFIEPGSEKPYIYGDFVRVNNVIRRGIARLNLDGTLDESFNAGFTDPLTVVSYAQKIGDNILIGGANLPNYSTLVSDTGAVVAGNVFENKPPVVKALYYNNGWWVIYASSTLDGQNIGEFYNSASPALAAHSFGASPTGAAIQTVFGASIVRDYFSGDVLAINAQYDYESPGVKGQFGRDLQYFSLTSGSGMEPEYAPYDVDGRVNFVLESSYMHILYGVFTNIRESAYPRYYRKQRSNVARVNLEPPQA